MGKKPDMASIPVQVPETAPSVKVYAGKEILA